MRLRKMMAALMTVSMVAMVGGCGSAPLADEDASTQVKLCADDTQEIQETKPGFGNLGSATEMEGITVILSVFVNDSKYSWDWDSEDDNRTCDDMLFFTDIAAKWLTENAAKNNCNANFIYDWSLDENLIYDADVSGSLVTTDDCDYLAWDYIDQNIDSQAILEEYHADNIIYLFFLNTDASINVTSCTRNYYEGMEYPYEICYMYCHCEGVEETPSAIAHEILHTFGAPDLYMADTSGDRYDNYGITREFVDKLTKEQSNDIMFTTYDCETGDCYYDHISNDFTDMDAYYVGLTDHCDEVESWGFQPSQHERKEE